MLNSIYIIPGPKQANGLIRFRAFFFKGTTLVCELPFLSGAPGRQVLTTVPTEVSGQLHPCPEGEYDLGPLDWKKPGSWTDLFRDIQSPYWVTVYRRRLIGIHDDGNRLLAPGSAGCWVPATGDVSRLFVDTWRKNGPFHKMYVDYGKGHVKPPAALKAIIEQKRRPA